MKYRMITAAAGTDFNAKPGDVVDGKNLPGDPDELVKAGWCVPAGDAGQPIAATRNPKRTATRKKAQTRSSDEA